MFVRLARLRPSAASPANNAFLHIGFKHAKCLFVPLDGHVERLEHALGREVVRHDPLLDLDWFSWHTKRLRVEAEVEDQLFGRASDSTKICVQANRVLVDDLHSGLPLLIGRRLGGALFFLLFLFGHVQSPVCVVIG